MPDDSITAVGEQEKPAGSEPTPEEVAPPKRMRRKKSLKLDADAIVNSVITRLDKGLRDRSDFMQIRLDRYAKLRGWLPTKDWPFSNCSNFWMPVIATASYRVKAALYNATLGMRPTIISKARQRQNQPKQDRIDRLLDYQVYVEADGETKFDDFISNFVDDFCAIASVNWVKEDQNFRRTKVFPASFQADDPATGYLVALRELFGSEAVATPRDKEYYTWDVRYTEGNQEKTALVDFYDRDDGRIEACITSKQTVYDGPTINAEDLEDIVWPIRSANLQPPSPSNPKGAPWVFVLCTTTMDQIRRLQKDGVYDLLSEDDLKAVEATKKNISTGREEDYPKQQKDELEGMQITSYPARDDETVELVLAYDRWDVDGDGLDEDVVFTIARESKKLCRVRYLSDICPGLPIRRPLAHASFISVPGRVLGVSLTELLESLQDMTKIIMDQNIDFGTIRNVPFFFYRASSGMRPEVIRYAPGEGYPSDNPQNDVYFPQWGQSDNSWFFNMMAVLQQHTERLPMIGDIQLGRIPQGKSAALRTTSNMMAVMNQGDVRGEQTLRRLLRGISQIYSIIHRLNQHFLPDNKEFRVIGVPKPNEEPYQTASIDEISAEVDFDFKATLLNTNRMALRQTLMETMQVIVSPLAVQMGLLTADQAYNLFEDYMKAGDLDSQRYLNRPTPEAGENKLLAEEAISMILDGQPPDGLPLEDPQEHYQKLLAFQQSEQFGLLVTEQQKAAFQLWLIRILRYAREQAMKQQLMAAATQFQQAGQMPGAQPVAGGGGPQLGSQGPVGNGEAQQEQAMGGANA